MRGRLLIGAAALVAVGLLGCKADEAKETESPDAGAQLADDAQSADTIAPEPDTKPPVTDEGPVEPDVGPVEPDEGPVEPDEGPVEPDVDAPPAEDVAVTDNDVADPQLDVESPPIDTGPAEPPKEPVDGQFGDGVPIDLFPPPPEPAPRGRKRVNMDQLQAAILVTTQLESWVAGKNTNLLEKNAFSLGRPDYESSITEDFEPGLLFDKLLGDAARAICPALMKKEKAAAAEERVFIKHAALEDTLESAPALIEQNMRMLLLRYHGNYLPAGSPQLKPWITLFTVASNDTEPPNPVDGWSVICTALLSHPDFISY